MSEVHAQARTTSRTRAEIKASQASQKELAQQYNVGRETVRKWQERENAGEWPEREMSSRTAREARGDVALQAGPRRPLTAAAIERTRFSLRNHTLAVGRTVRTTSRSRDQSAFHAQLAEMGIDVGYVRKARRKESSPRDSGSISIVAAAIGPRGAGPRVWASAQPRASKLHAEMAKFITDSGFGEVAQVSVISDAAKDLAALADKLPQNGKWMLDWAHIGRKLWQVDRLISPLAYGRNSNVVTGRLDGARSPGQQITLLK